MDPDAPPTVRSAPAQLTRPSLPTCPGFLRWPTLSLVAALPLVAALGLATTLPLAGPVAAQEPVTGAGGGDGEGVTQRVLLDNDRVRMLENRYEPGAESALHTHRWGRSVYVVQGGVLELVPEEGEATRVEVAAGQALWRPAETHAVRNPGSTTVVLVETEVKDATGTARARGDGTGPRAALDRHAVPVPGRPTP